MGRVQLRRLGEMHDRRLRIAKQYLGALADLPIDLPADGAEGDTHTWHLFIVRLRPEAPLRRNDFIAALASEGIGTSVHFIPLHRHTYWRESLLLEPASFPVADREFERTVSLPIFSRMTDDDAARVISAVRRLLSA
jgi:dTDP-4-amino-4,6-dideoxygalactose transaminase